MIEWERQIIHNMILVCDVYIYIGAIGSRSFTVFHFRGETSMIFWPNRWWYIVSVFQISLWLKRKAFAPLHQVLLGTEGEKGAAVRAWLPTGHNRIGEVEWSPRLGDSHTQKKKQGSSCRVEDFMLFYMVLQPITISLVAISPVEMSVKMSTSPQVLALHHAARDAQGWDFKGKNDLVLYLWHGEAFCIFGLYTIERPLDCLSDDP